MDNIVARFVVVMLFIVLPVGFAILLGQINRIVWLWWLSRRAGPVPSGLYIPKDVRFGWRPLGQIAVACAGVGMLLGLTGLSLENEPLANAALKYLFVPGLIVSLPLFLRWTWRMSLGGVPVLTEEEKNFLRQRIAELSSQLAQAEVPASGVSYLRFSRAGYRYDLLTEPGEPGTPFDITGLWAARGELDAVLASGAGKALVGEAHRLVARMRKTAAKYREKIRPDVREVLPSLPAMQVKGILPGNWAVTLADGTRLDMLINGNQIFITKGFAGELALNYQFPFELTDTAQFRLHSAGPPTWDVAFEVRDLILISIGDCRSFSETKERLQNQTKGLLDKLAREIEFGPTGKITT